MKYAKVQEILPKYEYVRELDPSEDSLLYDVFDGDQLIVDRKSKLTDNLIEDLERRDIRKIWVQTITHSWVPYEEALEKNLNIVETKEAHPVKDHLLKNFGDIKGIETLQQIIESYEEESLDEMTYSQLVSIRSHLPDLKKQEDRITEELHVIEDDDLRFRIIDVLRSRNPRLDPEDYPDSVQSLIKKISDFLTELREVKDEITELIMEIDPEKTPEVAEDMLQQQDFTEAEDETIVEAVEFAEELYSFDEMVYPDFLVEGICSDIDRVMRSVLFSGYWDEDLVVDLVESLTRAREELPALFWTLPEEAATEDNLFAQALSRLVIHSHVWPRDLFGDEEPRWIAAILFCDVGMVDVPETFWLHDDELSESQRGEVEKHPELGANHLESVAQFPEQALAPIRNHHYRGDNEGYPLEDPQWSTAVQKLALVDVFDALSSPRGYRDAYPPQTVYEKLESTFNLLENGLIEEMYDRIGDYPPGSMIRLDDGEVALVDEAGQKPSEPICKPLIMDDEAIEGLGPTIDLASDGRSIESSPRHRVAPWSVRRVRWKLDDALAPAN